MKKKQYQSITDCLLNSLLCSSTIVCRAVLGGPFTADVDGCVPPISPVLAAFELFNKFTTCLNMLLVSAFELL